MRTSFIENVRASVSAGKSSWASVDEAFKASLSSLSSPNDRRAALSKIEAELDEAIFPAGSISLVSAIVRQLRALQQETNEGFRVSAEVPRV